MTDSKGNCGKTFDECRPSDIDDNCRCCAFYEMMHADPNQYDGEDFDYD